MTAQPGGTKACCPVLFFLQWSVLWLSPGFGLLSLAIVAPGVVPVAAGMHALGGSAIRAMTLSVMIRATLGHTGRTVKAGPGALIVFAAAFSAALLRILAAFDPDIFWILLAGLAWSSAFLGFAAIYGRALMSPRQA